VSGAPAGRGATAIVVGGGLAGAAVAASLARRGSVVQVLDAAERPASGASGLPAGLVAPHVSRDDNLLSRLSRVGVRLTLEQARALLAPGDWAPSGVCERRAEGSRLHSEAGWIRPGALVRAWLAQPGIEWRGNTHVAALQAGGEGWQLLDARGEVLAQAPRVVVAAAMGTESLLAGRLPLNPVRGQVSWGLHSPGLDLPGQPLNGNGHFLPQVPWDGRQIWLTGSTYGRGETDLAVRAADHGANLERLSQLAPEIARQLAPAFVAGQVQGWTGVRCTSRDRRPLVGELSPGLWVSTAMGSRGLTFAALCGELIAARLHGEDLPLDAKLAQGLDVVRQIGLEPASRGRG